MLSNLCITDKCSPEVLNWQKVSRSSSFPVGPANFPSFSCLKIVKGKIWAIKFSNHNALTGDKISQMISQHSFRWWLGAVRQQAITWTNVDPDLCTHMASPGHNKLTYSEVQRSPLMANRATLVQVTRPPGSQNRWPHFHGRRLYCGSR